MNKEEILKKAQTSKSDEREEQVKARSFQIGWISVTVMMLLLIAFRAYYNESSNDIVLILMAQSTAVSFYQYKHLERKKIYLVAGIMGCVAIALGFAALLSNYWVY